MGAEPFSVKHTEALKLAPIPTAEDMLIKAGISTRNGGISEAPYLSLNTGFHVGDVPGHVKENRKRLSSTMQMLTKDWVAGEQVHGSDIQCVTKNDIGRGAFDLSSAIKGIDGLYTTDHKVVLTACYADCVPLYFYSRKRAVVGLAHAGWRGTVNEIAGKMIMRWHTAYNLYPEDIEVVIGPSIGPCCYEVDDKVMEQVHAISGIDIEKVLVSKSQGHVQLDLKKLNALILIKHGVPERQIRASLYCTSCRTDLFYSHRKEYGQTGRMLSYIGLRSGD